MKIGLIAMSGVRANNPELTELGLTLPGFVERNRKIASLPSLGLLTLAGLTPGDIDIDYVEVEDLDESGDLPGEYDAVGISSFSAQIFEAYELADRYRSAGTKVIMGGLHVTMCPEEALEHADAIVIGEGEPVWPDVMEDLRMDRLCRIYDARKSTFDLGQSPMPRFDLLDVDRYNRITVQTARGCPYDCEFCAASIRLSPKYRIKPAEKVIAEIRNIKRIWAHPFIEFADDNSFVHRRHSKNLLRLLAGEKVRWFTESDVGIASDPELLGLMRDSGCAQVLIGFESPLRSGLSGIERKKDWKARQLDHYMWAIDQIQSRGISVNGCFVLGLDGTGPESFDAVIEFVRQSGLHEVQVTVQTAFPNTPLYLRLKSEGRIIRDRAWELCTLFDVNFMPDRMGPEELESRFRSLVETVYSTQETARRKQQFFAQLRRARRNGTDPLPVTTRPERETVGNDT